MFFKTGTTAQIAAAQSLVAHDLAGGVLLQSLRNMDGIFVEASHLAKQHSALIGCRSLDILHCAAAKVLATTEFITTDVRQKALANAMGLTLTVV